MRRVLIMMAVSAFAVLAFAGAADAAPGQTFHVRFLGKFAEALWETSTSNTVTDTYTLAPIVQLRGGAVHRPINTNLRRSGQLDRRH